MAFYNDSELGHFCSKTNPEDLLTAVLSVLNRDDYVASKKKDTILHKQGKVRMTLDDRFKELFFDGEEAGDSTALQSQEKRKDREKRVIISEVNDYLSKLDNKNIKIAMTIKFMIDGIMYNNLEYFSYDDEIIKKVSEFYDKDKESIDNKFEELFNLLPQEVTDIYSDRNYYIREKLVRIMTKISSFEDDIKRIDRIQNLIKEIRSLVSSHTSPKSSDLKEYFGIAHTTYNRNKQKGIRLLSSILSNGNIIME